MDLSRKDFDTQPYIEHIGWTELYIRSQLYYQEFQQFVMIFWWAWAKMTQLVFLDLDLCLCRYNVDLGMYKRTTKVNFLC